MIHRHAYSLTGGFLFCATCGCVPTSLLSVPAGGGNCRCGDFVPMEPFPSTDYPGQEVIGYYSGCPVSGHPPNRELVYRTTSGMPEP